MGMDKDHRAYMTDYVTVKFVCAKPIFGFQDTEWRYDTL